MNTHRIPLVVIGAGYAGVTAANRLRARLTTAEAVRWQVTLIAPDSFLIDRVRLHEYAAGTRDEVRVPLRNLLHADVQHLAATVTRIDPGRREVHVAAAADLDPDPMRYDGAIVAVGSGADGASPDRSWHGVHNLEAARRLRAAVRGDAPAAVWRELRVIGGGATGVELAAELADSPATRHRGEPLSPRISLYGAAASFAGVPGRGQQRLRRILTRKGVELRPGTRVAPAEQDALAEPPAPEQSHAGDPEHTLTVWAGALAVPELGRASGLSVDGLGRIHTDDTLRVPGATRLYAAGDAGAVRGPRGRHLRMSCATAIPLGGHAADSLLSELRGEQPRPIDIGYAVQCLSLGRRSGLVQLVRPDDRPRGITVTGRPAAWVKWWICRSILKWPAGEARRPGSALVVRGPRS